LFTFTAETPLPAGRQGDRREGLVFDLVVRGHQIKSPQFFRDVNGRRPGASGESVVNPEPHVVRGLSPILQRNHPLSAASEPRTSHAPAGRVGGEKGCKDVYYFVLPLLTISIGPSSLSNKNEESAKKLRSLSEGESSGLFQKSLQEGRDNGMK